MAQEYEKTRSGLLVPTGTMEVGERPCPVVQPPSNLSRQAGRFAHVLNVGSLFIQLATVVVLWWTFQKTVIPIQQKELLAEQAARLERDNKSAAEELVEAKAILGELNSDLAASRRDLDGLQRQRQLLERESRQSQVAAASARRAELDSKAREQLARIAAKNASVSLKDAQWNIFSGTATWVVYRLNAHVARINREARTGDSNLSNEEEMTLIIDGAAKDWPDYREIVKETAMEIRQLRSPHFTPAMAAEFAAVFESEGASFKCQRPNFVAMKERYLEQLKGAKRSAMDKARADMRRIEAEHAAAGRRAVFEDGWESRTANMNYISEAMGVSVQLSQEVGQLSRECEDRFVKIGSEFLRSRTNGSEGMPGSALQ